MKEQEPIPEMNTDVAAIIPRVGDRKKLTGSIRVVVTGGYDLSFFPGEGISWDLTVKRITGGIEISGRISGKVTLECSRCLEDFDQSVDLRLMEHALWLGSQDTEPGDDYGEEYMVLDGTIDLLPVLRDAISLSLPSRRVCSEKCRGICPFCGVNLNVEQCGCAGEHVDGRLKPLLELKKRMERDKKTGP
jgi:uncharacterized protein